MNIILALAGRTEMVGATTLQIEFGAVRPCYCCGGDSNASGDMRRNSQYVAGYSAKLCSLVLLVLSSLFSLRFST